MRPNVVYTSINLRKMKLYNIIIKNTRVELLNSEDQFRAILALLLGMGLGPLELGKIALFWLKLGKVTKIYTLSFYCQTAITYQYIV